MSGIEFDPTSRDAVIVDLNDFNDLNISEEGELEVSRYFRHPIYLRLGSDMLKLVRMDMPSDLTDGKVREPDPTKRVSAAYLIQNVSSEYSDAHLLLDDAYRRHQDTAHNQLEEIVDMELFQRTSITLGRLTTPELRLSESVSDEHMNIRIGTFNGDLHFAGLDQGDINEVILHKDDAEKISPPVRAFWIEGTKIITARAEQGYWIR